MGALITAWILTCVVAVLLGIYWNAIKRKKDHDDHGP